MKTSVLLTMMRAELTGRGSLMAGLMGLLGTLTSGNEPLAWEELDASPGEYVIGFVFEDLDGSAFPIYKQITVR